jgi:hypothetical protein
LLVYEIFDYDNDDDDDDDDIQGYKKSYWILLVKPVGKFY